MFAQFLTAVVAIWVANESRAADFGRLSILLSVASVGAVLLNFGSVTSAMRSLAQGQLTAGAATSLIAQRSVIVSGVALGIAVFEATVLSVRIPLATCLAFYTVTMATSLASAGILRAQERFLVTAVTTVIDRALLVVMFLAFHAWWGLEPVFSFAAALLCGNCVAMICNQLFIGELKHLADFRPFIAFRVLKDSRHLGLAELSSDLAMLEVPLVGLAGGATVAGQFAAAARMAGPLGIPASAVSNAIAPALFREGKKHWRDALRNVNKTLWLLPAIWVALLVIAISASPLVSFSLGDSYGPSTANAVRIVCASVAISSVAQILALLLKAQRRDRSLARCFAVGVPLGLVVAAGGARYAGAVGAALGALFTQVLLTVWMGLLIRQDHEARVRPNTSPVSIP